MHVDAAGQDVENRDQPKKYQARQRIYKGDSDSYGGEDRTYQDSSPRIGDKPFIKVLLDQVMAGRGVHPYFIQDGTDDDKVDSVDGYRDLLERIRAEEIRREGNEDYKHQEQDV